MIENLTRRPNWGRGWAGGTFTFSTTPPTRPQVEPIKKFLTTLFSYSVIRTRLVLLRVFPDTSSSFLDSSLESSVLESEAEDSGKETANPECKSSDGQWRESPKAKTNGKCKLASTQLFDKIAKYKLTYCGRIY